ncbi:MAG: sigma-70 family RNA polymerase sigma factor [Clostridia bacterium]|nr:sigma-70 family RNA polymerase sigma factor [Clostridia bacterium]
MNKHNLDIKIQDEAKTILSFCIARTSSYSDAEDLAQDIIVEIYKSVGNLKNEKAFYAFMWSVAGNVYKQWCRKKAKKSEVELTENLIFQNEEEEDLSEVYLLRRELTLLNQKYRKAIILYYIDGKSCCEISEILSISESMVKYLLFKSRQILKEGMKMERNYGSQSYNPKGLSLLFWGNETNRYYNLCDSKISQNILFACYNDKLTAEQISLEIGVALPYMEDKISELCEFDLLKKDGNRYYTNIVIFTRDFMREVTLKTAELREKIASIISASAENKKSQIRQIGFYGSDMSDNSLLWQIACFILFEAVIENLHSRTKIQYPKDKFGEECFIWGAEECEENYWKEQFGFWVSACENSSEDYIHFMDFPINGERINDYFFDKQNAVNIFIDIAKNKTEFTSENDMAIIAEMIRNGYIKKDENILKVNAPVLTARQREKVKEIFADEIEAIAVEAEKMMSAVEKILKNHMPIHLKGLAKAMAYLRLFEDALAAPVATLVEEKYLIPYNGDSLLPTTFVILK